MRCTIKSAPLVCKVSASLARTHRGAFTFVRELQRRHPAATAAAAWHHLNSLVDAIAPSLDTMDAAYFTLEEMHRQASVSIHCYVRFSKTIRGLSSAFANVSVCRV